MFGRARVAHFGSASAGRTRVKHLGSAGADVPGSRARALKLLFVAQLGLVAVALQYKLAQFSVTIAAKTVVHRQCLFEVSRRIMGV